MTALAWVAGVYLAVGVVIGVWGAQLHNREYWRRMPEPWRHGPRKAVVVLVVIATAAVAWPYVFISGYRSARRVVAGGDGSG